MRLFEAIIQANHQAVAGDKSASLHPADFADSLPIAALTCIDPRLNTLLPSALGLPDDQFIWLRNAGNIITGPLSSTTRSLALACAVKEAEEIAIIGHTDCQVCKTTTMQLMERLKNLGIERHMLPDNINEYFGMFSSERQNVIKACEIVRSSPVIGPKVPVHGLLLDIHTGKVEWLVNGYEKWATMGDKWNDVVKSAGESLDKLKTLTDFRIGEMKFPDTKIGETVVKAEDWLSKKIEELDVKPVEKPRMATAPPVQSTPPPLPPPPAPKRIPVPPPIRPHPGFRRK